MAKIAQGPSVIAAQEAEASAPKKKTGVMKYIASKYKNPTLAELVRRLNPVYAAKHPEKNYLHIRRCAYCTEEIIIFRFHFMPEEIPGSVCMNEHTGQLYFKCSDYHACKQRKLDLQS